MVNDESSHLPPGLWFLVTNLQHLVTVKLDSTNFMVWRTQIQNIFRANNMLSYIDPNSRVLEMLIQDVNGVLISNPAYEEWLAINNHLISCLTATLSATVLPYVLNLNRTIDIWWTLEKRFSSLFRSHVHQFKKKLHDISKGEKSMEVYLQEIKTIVDNLASSNVVVDNEDLVLFTLNGLMPEYNALCTYVRARPTPISVVYLSDLLISEEIHVLKQPAVVHMNGSLSEFKPAGGSTSRSTMVLQAT